MRTSRSLFALSTFVVASFAHADFTETYDAGTQDVGDFILTYNTIRPRVIETGGGNSGGYLYGEYSGAIPGWGSASTRYEPGYYDEFKRDSVFTGDYYSAGVTGLSADLDVFQAGSWTEGRAVTLELVTMDETGYNELYRATKTIDLPDQPVGWNTYSFDLDAQAAAVPEGWIFSNRATGEDGTAAEWTDFMHRIDLVSFDLYQDYYGYPSLGIFKLGLDNVTIRTQATPEPTTLGAVTFGAFALVRRRRR